jgi:hypothetical protein
MQSASVNAIARRVVAYDIGAPKEDAAGKAPGRKPRAST